MDLANWLKHTVGPLFGIVHPENGIGGGGDGGSLSGGVIFDWKMPDNRKDTGESCVSLPLSNALSSQKVPESHSVFLV